jgi:sugar lactone lactonase YvrE
MGKPSHTNPMRAFNRPVAKMMGRIVLLFANLLFGANFAGVKHCDAQATALPLVLPSAIVFDAQGNLYFAEAGNHVVRVFSTAGVVSTIVGNGVQGFAGDNGAANAAELDSPSGLAIDAAGNLYIADTHNHRVRKFTAATALITTIAGMGKAGYSGDGGPATAAQLDRPTALAIDPAGNLYFADTDNHRVRRIAAGTGVITTVAGDGIEGFSGDGGPATLSAIDSPSGLAIDADGNLFVADTHNGRIRRVDAATGTITTFAGVSPSNGNTQSFTGDGGAAIAAGLALPRGLTLDAAGNLYVADYANHRIRRISGGTISTIAGQGTETFAGDGAPAVAASLDSPRSVTVSPAGLLTLADSGNQRVRQLDALPAPGPDIHTLVGLGNTVAGMLTLTGPSVVAYGGGALTAAFNGVANETGSITFIDTAGSTPVLLGSGALVSGSASFAIGSLAVGPHAVFATYAGDSLHGAAQSSTLAVTITPLSITAAPAPASALYGQTIPSLSGTLNGVLAQDAGTVSAVFSTTAVRLSPVGSYPITAALSGSAAADYSLTTVPAALTIAKAPTITTLTPNLIAPGVGQPLTFSIQTATSTSGVPTGNVSLFDGGSSLSSPQTLAGGTASLTLSTLSQGPHNVSAVYSGDSNFLPSSSVSTAIIVGTTSDFSLTPTGATAQSVPAGSAATFNFSVTMQGAAIPSPIVLAVQGTPVGATASLNPSYIPPGGVVTSFTLTIQTPLAEMHKIPMPRWPGAPVSPLLGVLLVPGVAVSRRLRRARRNRLAMVLAAGFACIVPLTLTMGCGDRINAAAESVNAASYTLTVSGTATSSSGTALQHSANVTLKVI